jgi:NhaP-type Na+/H+ or K+/H+ antiporter
MLEHTQRRAVGPWRRWAFRVWIGLTGALALYIVTVLPFVRDDRIGPFLLGVPVPFVMIALLMIGLGWLVWLVTARRHTPERTGRRDLASDVQDSRRT